MPFTRRKLLIRSLGWAFLAFLFFLFLPAVFVAAAETTEDPYVILVAEGDEAKSVFVGSLQDRLAELGYYSGKKSLLYDEETQLAVLHFTIENGLPYSEQGLRQSVWEAIMREDAVPNKGNILYEDLYYGETSDAVLSLQMRLKSLNYFGEDLVLSPGTYDADTQQAIALFCAENNILYEEGGISAEVQQLIFSDGAVSYTPPESTFDISEYMMRDTDLAVGAVPMFVVWVLCAVLIVLIVALVLRFFVRDGRRRGAVAAPTANLDEGFFPQSLPSVKKPRAKKPAVQIQMEYNGHATNHTLDVWPITIGRGTDNVLRLDENDLDASGSHCTLQYEGNLMKLTDHSTNGTLVNDAKERIHHSEYFIHSGDMLTVGTHHILIQF